jgi:hypothetical protein
MYIERLSLNIMRKAGNEETAVPTDEEAGTNFSQSQKNIDLDIHGFE